MKRQQKEESIGRLMSYLNRYGRAYIGGRLDFYGIGKGQFIFLAELFKANGVSQDEMAKFLHFDKGTTARALHKLERSGFVERRQDAKDKRVVRVYLTPKGRKFKPVLFSVLHSWSDALFQGFSEAERKEVLAYVRRMAQNALELSLESSGQGGISGALPKGANRKKHG